MDEKSVTVLGYLDHDGNLRLDERPALSPGVVEVTIKPYSNYREGETLLESMTRTRAEAEASGRKFRTKEEIDADLEADRDGGEDRLDEIHRQAEASRSTQPTDPNTVTNGPATNEPPEEPLGEFMERTHAELEASGHRFRTKEEIDAEIEEMRDWGEERIEAATTPAEGYGPYLARIRARREADGFPFRSKAEIDAEIEELPSWDEEPEETPEAGESREAEG